MPIAGDHYSIVLKQAHINWGTHRYTDTRDKISGEGYVPIPSQYARKFNIQKGSCFTAVFADGYPSFRMRAAGNAAADEILAKQFQGDGDLKAFGRWYASCNATIGDRVSVTFIDSNTVQFELCK